MSRSRPNMNGGSNNPAERWFQWKGSEGEFQWYNKEKKKNVSVDFPFTFLLLDQLSTVKGWHDSSNSAIYANEVRNMNEEEMVVKSFKRKTELARGLYPNIKQKVKAEGGRFNASLYVAFKNEDGELALGNVMLQGGALSAWMDLTEEAGDDIYSKAVVVKKASKLKKKGAVKYKDPVFSLVDVSEETDQAATELDIKLQEYLDEYLQTEGRVYVQEDSQDVDNDGGDGVDSEGQDADWDDSDPF